MYILFSVFLGNINELSLTNETEEKSSATTEYRPLIIVGFQIDFLIVKIGRGFLFKYYDRCFLLHHHFLLLYFRIETLDPLVLKATE